MSSYRIEKSVVSISNSEGHLFAVGFADPAQNDKIVRDVQSRLEELKPDLGGPLALINGPASVPAAVVLAHHLLHVYACIGVFDPKMQAYVIASGHGGNYKVGDIIPASEVS